MISLQRRIDFEKYYKEIIGGCFGVIIILKIILMGLFSSDYQDVMFIPFVVSFLNGETNPYEYYYQNQFLSSFPYPPLMLNTSL